MDRADKSNPIDFEKMFDLNRSTLVIDMVQRMQECMRLRQAADDDLKEVIAECKEKELDPKDINAMKTIAKLRLDGKEGAAREKLAALQKISKAVGTNLFEFE